MGTDTVNTPLNKSGIQEDGSFILDEREALKPAYPPEKTENTGEDK